MWGVLDGCSNQCIAVLDVVKQVLLEAFRRRMAVVELRLDVKTMVFWLQRKILPIPEVVAIVEHVLFLLVNFVQCRFVFIQPNWN